MLISQKVLCFKMRNVNHHHFHPKQSYLSYEFHKIISIIKPRRYTAMMIMMMINNSNNNNDYDINDNDNNNDAMKIIIMIG